MNLGNARDQQAAYDQLPPEIRSVIAAAPVKINAVAVLNTYRQYGTSKTLYMVQRNIEAVMIALNETRGAA